MTTLISLTLITLLLALWLSELIARRQADARAALLRAHLDDAIGVEIDQYEENKRLSAALADALNERNAANLRAARAARSLQALPAMQFHDGHGQPLLVRLSPYSLN